MASVRGALPQTEVMKFGADVLDEMLNQDSTLGNRLKAVGQRYLENRLVRRTRLVRGLMANLDFQPEERTLENGTVLYRHGSPNQGFYVVLSGHVELFVESDGLPTRLARLGTGLCVGERDDETYSATAIVDGTTRLLVFPRGTLAGAHARSPEVQEHLSTLQRVWDLPQQGFVSQYMGVLEGLPCLTQLYNLKDGRSLVATHVIGGESVQLDWVEGAPQRTITTPSNELSVELDQQGMVCAIHSQLRGPELGILFGRAIEGLPLRPEEEQSLAETGQIQVSKDGYLCTCLQVRRSSIHAALQAGVCDLATLQQRTGAGLSCGSCIPSLREALGEGSFHKLTISKIEEPTSDVRRIFLKPPNDTHLPSGRPGQHVILRTFIDHKPVARPYTLSSAMGALWEVTVKRQPNGSFSTWLFEQAQEGTQLDVSLPQGEYVWDGGPAPVVCFVCRHRNHTSSVFCPNIATTRMASSPGY